MIVCNKNARIANTKYRLNDEANHSKAIYVDGNVIATLTATLRPDAEVRSSRSRRHFRGLPIFVLHRLVKVFLISRFSTKGSSLLKCFLLNVTTELLLLNLKVANVHAILAQHSETPYYRRILSWSTWSKTFPAMLLYSIASSICFYLPAYLIHLSGVWGGELKVSENMQFASVLSTITILYFGAMVPAYAIFIRVAASAQENGPISIKSAWQSFPWSARFYFFKSLAEVLVMEIGVSIVLFVFVLAHFHPELHDDVVQFLVKYAG